MDKEQTQIECIKALLKSFPGSYINSNWEFIAEEKRNIYFLLSDCEKPIDVECKVLERLSEWAKNSDASCWRIRDGINAFLGTDFKISDMRKIYEHISNTDNHEMIRKFISSGYNMEIFEVSESQKACKTNREEFLDHFRSGRYMVLSDINDPWWNKKYEG